MINAPNVQHSGQESGTAWYNLRLPHQRTLGACTDTARRGSSCCMPSSSSRWIFYFILQPVSDMDNPFQKEHKRCILCKYNLDVDYKVWCRCACEMFQLALLTFISRYTGLWLFKAYTSMFWKKMQQVASFWTVRSVLWPSATDNLGRIVWANCAFWQQFPPLLLLAGISHGGAFPSVAVFLLSKVISKPFSDISRNCWNSASLLSFLL